MEGHTLLLPWRVQRDGPGDQTTVRISALCPARDLVSDAAEYSAMSGLPGPQGARHFGTLLRVRGRLPSPSSQEGKSGWGVNQKHMRVSRSSFIWGGAGLCPACPVPGRWLHFFRVSKVSFWIPLASSPISFQYSLNLTSESWFTSKLFILSSKEPTS